MGESIKDQEAAPRQVSRRQLTAAAVAGVPIIAIGALSLVHPESAWSAPHIVRAIAAPQAAASDQGLLSVSWSEPEAAYNTLATWLTTLTVGNDSGSSSAASSVSLIVENGPIVKLSNVDRDASTWSRAMQIGEFAYSFQMLTPLQPGHFASLTLTYEQTLFVDPFLSGATATANSSEFSDATSGVYFSLDG